MSFYQHVVYPALVQRLGNPPPIQALRRQVVPRAHGTVLEIGSGSGANFEYYDASTVNRLYALEPNYGMRRLAEAQRRRTSIEVQFLSMPGERVPLADATIDTVVSTFTLCTISAVREALNEIARVLRSDGALLFIENTLSEDAAVRRWQRAWEPLHHRVFAGLYLTRDIPSLLMGAGFAIERLGSGYLARFPRSWSHCCWGAAARA